MNPVYLMGDEELNSDFPFSLKIHRLDGKVTPHGHNFIEFTYSFQGHGTEVVNGIAHELKPGTFTLLFPFQVHEIIPDPGEEVSLFVGGIGLKAFFSADDTVLSLNRLLLEAENDQPSFFLLDKPVSDQVLGILRQMHSETRESPVWNRIMFKVKLAELLVIVARYRSALKENASDSKYLEGRSNIRKIVHFVYKNFSEDITLDSLSKKFFLSVPHISSTFKQYCGENFHSFLEKIRIAHTCSLLVTSDLPITAIAFEVGFKSFASFSRAFSRLMQMSPTAYRKQKRISLISSNKKYVFDN